MGDRSGFLRFRSLHLPNPYLKKMFTRCSPGGRNWSVWAGMDRISRNWRARWGPRISWSLWNFVREGEKRDAAYESAALSCMETENLRMNGVRRRSTLNATPPYPQESATTSGSSLPFTAGPSWTTVWTTTFSKDPQKAQKRPLAHCRNWRGSSEDFEGVVVPRDRIELSTPAFSGLCPPALHKVGGTTMNPGRAS